MNFRTTALCETTVKNGLLLYLCGWGFPRWVLESQKNFPQNLQGSVLSIAGLLLAAAIVGAFELSYSRTPLEIRHMRYLAHASKFLLYTAIGLLLTIAMGAMGSTPGFFNDPIAFAGLLVFASLLLYDFWDILCALEKRIATK